MLGTFKPDGGHARLMLLLGNTFIEIQFFYKIYPFEVGTEVWFSVHSQSCATLTTIMFRTFHDPRRNPGPFVCHPHIPTHLLPSSMDLV